MKYTIIELNFSEGQDNIVEKYRISDTDRKVIQRVLTLMADNLSEKEENLSN